MGHYYVDFLPSEKNKKEKPYKYKTTKDLIRLRIREALLICQQKENNHYG